MFPICHTIDSRLEALRFEVALIINCIVLAVAISIAGVFYIKAGQAEARKAAQDQLTAIADLKARQVVDWRRERQGDAQFFSRARFAGRDVKELLDKPGSKEARRGVLDWLELLKSGERYQRVILFDTALNPRLSIPGPDREPTAPSKALLTEAVIKKKVVMSDLHVGASADDIHFDLAFPIFDPAAPAGASAPVIAIIQLQLDPHRFLYPLIRSWPTRSTTAETLLVRREGNDVLFLNDLRGKPGTALSFRLPLSRTNLPAAAAVLGFTGVMEGNDYRGVPVVAVSRPIPGSSWFIETKMDREELYAPLRQQARMGGIIFGALLVAGGLLVALLWRRRTTAELKKANIELEKRVQERTADLNAKNRELECFTSSVSHDLKTPLRGIEGYSDLLWSDYGEKLDDEGKKYLQSIRHSAQKMNHLVEDLLRYSRLEWQAISMEKVDPAAIVKEILEESKEELQRGRVKVTTDIAIAPFLADASGLSQALRNLIGNALKFSSKAPEPLLEIRGRENGKVCTLEVRDNGIGFDMLDKERIFEIFKRLPRASSYPGTGVGLAIVRKSIQRMGGRVWAESEPGKGAAFFLEIPRR